MAMFFFCKDLAPNPVTVKHCLLACTFLCYNLVICVFYTNKMEDGDFDQRLRDLQREYLEFLDDEVSVSNLLQLFLSCGSKFVIM